LANAEQILQRRQELVGDGSVSKEDLDNAQTTRDTYYASLKQAEASLGVAVTNLKDTEVYAPTDGIILTRVREPGTVVKASDPIYTLSVISPVWIRAYVTEPELGQIYFGMEGEIHTDTPSIPVYKGKIGFISPVSEFTPKTVETTQLRTDLVYRIRVYAQNPDRFLKQGMPVTVVLPLKPKAKKNGKS
jgi:HlyD family secretion protein